MIQKCRDQQKEVQVCFIDYIMINLYWKQLATVKTEQGTSKELSSILSTLLFNLYSEEIFPQALTEFNEGIKINGEVLNNIRYADDTVLMADSEAMLNKVYEITKNTD